MSMLDGHAVDIYSEKVVNSEHAIGVASVNDGVARACSLQRQALGDVDVLWIRARRHVDHAARVN